MPFNRNDFIVVKLATHSKFHGSLIGAGFIFNDVRFGKQQNRVTSPYSSSLQLPELYERGELPYGAVKRDILLPGMAPVPPEDVWRSIADGSHPHHQQLRKTFQNLGESSSIILNTFEELEAQTLKALRTDYAAANIKVRQV